MFGVELEWVHFQLLTEVNFQSYCHMFQHVPIMVVKEIQVQIKKQRCIADDCERPIPTSAYTLHHYCSSGLLPPLTTMNLCMVS